MSHLVDFHTQLASIMEVLANAAVAEICQLVDDGFATLRLEISRSQRENLALKNRLRLMEACSEEQHPQQPVTSTRTDDHFRHEFSQGRVQSISRENPDTQHSQITEEIHSWEPEVGVVKKESVEEEDHQAAPNTNSIGPPCFSAGHEDDPPSTAAEDSRLSAAGRCEKEDFTTPGPQQQVPTDWHCVPSAVSGSGPNRADLSKEEDRHVGEALESKHTGLKATRAALVSAEVKLEVRNECVSNSTSADRQHTENDVAELDTGSFDCSAFDELFSSPEVARSLTAPHKHSTDAEELSSSFPFMSSFGNSSMSDSRTASSSSRSRSFSSRTERALSCQQCTSLFSTSRDLLVHQRCHVGEKVYHCPMCKKPFMHPHQLKTHQRVHTGEKPFSCTQCGRRFSQSSHIKRHMSVHTGEKRYSCSLCGKRFSQACSLKVHQAVHTGERPYSCTKCSKSFSVLGNLVRHQSVHVSK